MANNEKNETILRCIRCIRDTPLGFLIHGTLNDMRLNYRYFASICVTSLLIIQGCGEVSEETTVEVVSTSTQTVEPTVRGADITLEWDERDFGTIWDFESLTTTFPFTNTGTSPLVLTRLQAGCGCTTPVADKTVLQPGESGTITVTFNPSGKSKKQDKKVTIFSNSVRNPEKAFWIRSYVNTFVGIDQKFLKLEEMKLGVPNLIEFDFFPVDPNFTVTSMIGNGKHGKYITAEELPMPDGSPRRIRINISPDMPWGAFHSQLLVKGRGTTPDGRVINHSFTMFANGKTFGKLKADKHILSVGSLKKGESYHERLLIYREDGAPFEVLNTSVLNPTVAGINATAVQMLDGSYEIIVSGTLPPAHVGSINGEILIQTDVFGEEILNVRIAGVVPKK